MPHQKSAAWTIPLGDGSLYINAGPGARWRRSATPGVGQISRTSKGRCVSVASKATQKIGKC